MARSGRIGGLPQPEERTPASGRPPAVPLSPVSLPPVLDRPPAPACSTDPLSCASAPCWPPPVFSPPLPAPAAGVLDEPAISVMYPPLPGWPEIAAASEQAPSPAAARMAGNAIARIIGAARSHCSFDTGAFAVELRMRDIARSK